MAAGYSTRFVFLLVLVVVGVLVLLAQAGLDDLGDDAAAASD